MALAGGATAVSLRPDLLPRFSTSDGSVRISVDHKRRPHDSIDQALHETAIADAVAQARTLYLTKDEIALADASRNCQQRFRADPGFELLDRCAAFDNAVIGLRDRDPLRDGGPFAPLAVTGRQWSAASSLSDDYMAIDSRLDRIRLQVDLQLAALQASVAPAAAASVPSPRATPRKGRWKWHRRSRQAASGPKR